MINKLRLLESTVINLINEQKGLVTEEVIQRLVRVSAPLFNVTDEYLVDMVKRLKARFSVA